MGMKKAVRDEVATHQSLVNLIKNAVFIFGIAWALGEIHLEKYVDGRIEANKAPIEEKLSWKLANEIKGAEQEDVHKFIGGMFNTLTGITDTISDFNKTKLPKLMRLTELIWVGPVVNKSHNWYIDFDNEPYRIRGIGTAQPYWHDANNVKRDLAGRRIR